MTRVRTIALFRLLARRMRAVTPAAAHNAAPRAPAAASAGARRRRSRVPFTQFTLPNGLHVILHEDHTVPLATVNVWYHVGSAREKPGRTGFAHLFEHLMFEGSAHVKEGEFDTLLEARGRHQQRLDRNRPHELLHRHARRTRSSWRCSSNRIAWATCSTSMSPERVNGQRDVVKNERRQNYENRPTAWRRSRSTRCSIRRAIPISWPTIGYMEDLTAASYEDVVEFFKKYYQPATRAW